MVRVFGSHLCEPGFPVKPPPDFSHMGIVPDDAAGRRVFSGIFRFPRTCIQALLHAHLASLSAALKTSLRALRFYFREDRYFVKHNNFRIIISILHTGPRWLAVSPLASHQGDPGSFPGRVTPDFRMWESGRTMPLVGGFSRGSPVYPTRPFRRCSILTSNTFIGSQDLDAKTRPNIFTRYYSYNK
ncbi:hypothetical protein PR048_030064 [Dryococelus australis]|uniref:Uncharacterized protein n=1 Tax=Dryococelus australis TaxID=614101 RepID=A0ABQ9G7X3_9NEOP|nr:hypothetical protein PR048_030064 [Dryococelus australis]